MGPFEKWPFNERFVLEVISRNRNQAAHGLDSSLSLVAGMQIRIFVDNV